MWQECGRSYLQKVSPLHQIGVARRVWDVYLCSTWWEIFFSVGHGVYDVGVWEARSFLEVSILGGREVLGLHSAKLLLEEVDLRV